MRSVRIEPVDGGKAVLVDVVCECGMNGLTNKNTGKASFKHLVSLGGTDFFLMCGACKAEYILHPQLSHLHINRQ